MRKVFALLVVLTVLAMPAMAGDKGKCTGSAEDCLAKMQAKLAQKGWLGIEYDTDEHGRWVVKAVEKDSPAALAGFEKGDVLLSLNGQAYTNENKAALKAEYAKLAPGSEATYVVKRQGGKLELQATLGKVPAELQAKWIAQHMKEHHPEVKMASK